MGTTTTLRNKLKALEKVQGLKETEIFFIDGGSDEALTQAQWEAVSTWKKAHPWGTAHVIIFEEVGLE